MMRLISALAWLLTAGLLAACTATPPLAPADHAPPTRAVHVIGDGWHTSIVIARSEVVATGQLPEAEDFPDAAFLKFGWGDRVYYPARTKTIGMTLNAALWASPAVMHVAGLARLPASSPSGTKVVRVALTDTGFRRLVRTIAGEFERPGSGRAKPVSRGLYPDSNFYDAHGGFHLFNTCNTWTARMLRAGGLDISPSGIVTGDDLMARLRSVVGSDQRSGAPLSVANRPVF